MPLLLPVLAEQLIKMDEPSSPKTPEATAEAWTQAWWAYAKDMAFWAPGMGATIEAAAVPAFRTVLLPGCVPNPIPGTFYLAYELASIAGWVAGSAIPGSLLPAYSPVPLVPPPPGTLVAALVLTVPIGLVSPTKHPVRIAMATAIDVWTHLIGAVLSAPPPPPALPTTPIF